MVKIHLIVKSNFKIDYLLKEYACHCVSMFALMTPLWFLIIWWCVELKENHQFFHY